MPFLIPTFSALRTQVYQDIRAANFTLLPQSVLKVLGDAISALSYLHSQYLSWIAKQAVPFTAESKYLEAWAALKGVYRKDATAAIGNVAFTGTSGTVIATNTLVVRADGFQYSTTAPYEIGVTTSVGIVATTSGSIGNAASSTTLALTTAISGVSSVVTFVGDATGGTDQESDDALRTRTLIVYANPPMGGDAEDYVEWAEEVPGVTRAWANGSGYGPGTVVVYVALDVVNASNNGFPVGTDGCATAEARYPTVATGDQLAVANYIYPLRPITATVIVCAPTAYPINVTTAGLLVDDATAAAIDASMAALYLSAGTALGMQIYPSQIVAAISAIVPTSNFTLVSPASPVTIPLGSLPTVGVVQINPPTS